jgi:hypothetical protein
VDQRSIKAVTISIAVVRCAIGAALVAQPRTVGRLLAGEASTSAPAQILLRSLGVRDLVLGVGTLQTALRNQPLDTALATGATSDAVDAFAIGAAAREVGMVRSVPGMLASLSALVTQLWLLVAHRRARRAA